MGFSPKEIKMAQIYAENIAKEKEAKYAEKHKNDKPIPNNRSVKD